jgi:hypothetical protein
MLNKIKEKKLYLCDVCKKVGIRSYKIRTFESFDCPNCKQTTTLFIPVSKNKKEEKVVAPKEIQKEVREAKEVSSNVSYTQKSSLNLNLFLFFMMGFIVALFITKK